MQALIQEPQSTRKTPAIKFIVTMALGTLRIRVWLCSMIHLIVLTGRQSRRSKAGDSFQTEHQRCQHPLSHRSVVNRLSYLKVGVTIQGVAGRMRSLGSWRAGSLAQATTKFHSSTGHVGLSNNENLVHMELFSPLDHSTSSEYPH